MRCSRTCIRAALAAALLGGAAARAGETAGEAAGRAALLQRGVTSLVFAVRTTHSDGHWYANFGYYVWGTNETAYGAGGRLVRLDPATGGTKLLVDDPGGAVRDPAVHYDGRTIVFAWRRAGTATFHLYTIDADGAGLRQITDSPYDDMEPCWLPDGGLAFVSARARRWVNCWMTQVATLHRCDADGRNVRVLSANLEQDNTPWVLPDGRLMYQRWEYVDRSQVHYHHLWTMNPDGTGQMTFFGNLHPGDVYLDAKPIPGSDEVVLINSPGHGQREHAGRLAVLTPAYGPDRLASLRNLTKEADVRDPWALGPDAFLAARGRSIRLYDRAGGSEAVFTLPEGWKDALAHEPRPLAPRAREAVAAARTNPARPTGTLILANVYHGRTMGGVAPGQIKELLVMETLPKPANYSGGMEPLTWGGSFTLERVVGTVPVEADGSACFELPANRAFFFIALDAQERAVKRMQSFCSVAPGESTGCLGCHEHRNTTVTAAGAGGRLLALQRPASAPAPVAGVPEVFDYPRDIQPIWDRHCVACHNPDRRDGGVLLTGDQGPYHSLGYVTLFLRNLVADGRNRPQSNYAPYALGDAASPLMKLVESRHQGAQLSAAEVRTVRYWIHAGAPWPGTYAALGGGMIGNGAVKPPPRTQPAKDGLAAAQAALDRRCGACHEGAAPPLARSPWEDVDTEGNKLKRNFQYARMTRHILYNLSRPEKSTLLLAPLARAAGGWAAAAPGAAHAPAGACPAVFADTADPDYRALLAGIQVARQELDALTRFNQADFRPPAAYLREMKRYGVLPADFDAERDRVDVYELDKKYWESFWYHPPPLAAGLAARQAAP